MTSDAKLIEIMALALWKSALGRRGIAPEGYEANRQSWENDASAALSALRAAGYAVLKIPTKEALGSVGLNSADWESMVSAAEGQSRGN